MQKKSRSTNNVFFIHLLLFYCVLHKTKTQIHDLFYEVLDFDFKVTISKKKIKFINNKF